MYTLKWVIGVYFSPAVPSYLNKSNPNFNFSDGYPYNKCVIHTSMAKSYTTLLCPTVL